MRTRANPASASRGLASSHSMPSLVPASDMSKAFSTSAEPASSAAGVEPRARESLRTVTWIRSRSWIQTRSPSPTMTWSTGLAYTQRNSPGRWNTKLPVDSCVSLPPRSCTVCSNSPRADWVPRTKLLKRSIAAASTADTKARRKISRNRIDLLRLRGNQHLAVAVRLHGRDHAGSLHVLDQASGAVVADAQVALYQRDRRTAGAQHDVASLVVQRVFLARRQAVDRRLFRDFRLQHFLDVLGLGQRLQMLDHLVDLVIGDESAVHALRYSAARRQVEHVAHAEQRLGARLVEDGARVDLGGDLERDARRDVGFDQAGDHVDRRPLRGEHQVDAGGARLAGEAGDQLLHFLADHHHQVGELVDHHHVVRPR